MKKFVTYFLVAAMVFTFIPVFQGTVTAKAATKSKSSVRNTIILDGSVYTVNSKQKHASAVVIKGKKIVYVGTDSGALKYKNKKSKIIDAKGGTVMPSLVDSHMHFNSFESYLYQIQMGDCMSKDAILKRIKDYVKANPGLNVYLGTGWSAAAFPSSGPTREELDKICPDKPMILTEADGHAMWVNSKALEESGITVKDSDAWNAYDHTTGSYDNGTGTVVLDSDHNPTGYLKELATELVSEITPSYTKAEIKKAVLYGQNWLVKAGFTTIFDAGMNVGTDKNYYQAIEELAEAGKLKIRIRGAWWVQPTIGNSFSDFKAYIDKARKIDKTFKTDYYKVNTVKLMADQVLEMGTAYMSDGYIDSSTGQKVKSDNGKVWKGKEDILKQILSYSDNNGMQIHIHQIGDGGASYMLDILEELQNTTNPNLKNHRATFAHCQFISEKDKKRMAELGMNAVVAPYWSVMDDYYWDVYAPLVGRDTLDTDQYPMQSLIDDGINVGIHSDFFVTEPNIGWLFYSAMTRTLPKKVYDSWYPNDSLNGQKVVRVTDPTASQNPSDYDGAYVMGPLKPYSERLTLKEVIKASTYGGAYANYLDKEIGTIQVGKKADIIIFSDDLFTMDKEDIANIDSPKYTIFGGKVVYKSK